MTTAALLVLWLAALLWFCFCAVAGFLAFDLAHGRHPRWLETTRFTLAQILHREGQYWHGHDIAKYGYDRMERFK